MTCPGSHNQAGQKAGFKSRAMYSSCTENPQNTFPQGPTVRIGCIGKRGTFKGTKQETGNRRHLGELGTCTFQEVKTESWASCGLGQFSTTTPSSIHCMALLPSMLRGLCSTEDQTGGSSMKSMP